MLRAAAIIATITVFATGASATEHPNLAADLAHFVTAFDLEEVGQRNLQVIERILNDPSLSHGQKVLKLHSILERNGALEHVDMHGANTLLTAGLR